ncbi:MAG: PHB depolymerase family esterase [Myxococcaceae bacterium]
MTRALGLTILTSTLLACSGVSPTGSDSGTGGGGNATGGGSGGGGATGGGATGGGSTGGGSADDAGVDAGVYMKDPLIAQRPFAEVVPVSYAAGTPTPLVLELHGYTATGATQDAYFKFAALAQQKGFLLALPDGLVDGQGQHYWNATDACCAFGAGPDDVAYLTAVIEDMKKRYTVDPKRIFVVGHSNGGFMAHRLACERSDLIAAVMSLAGAVWADPTKCAPSSKISVLQVHGTLDGTIAYNGGAAVTGAPPFPGAETTVRTWATKNGCTGTTLDAIGGDLDLVFDLPLSETNRLQFTGCPSGAAAELWKINGGSHIPNFNNSWADTVYTWLSAHPKP